MNIKQILLIGLTALTLSLGASASFINVGGVIWDPESSGSYPNNADFTSGGVLFESAVQFGGDVVVGFGKFNDINSQEPNQSNFCPGCELTFTFSMILTDDFSATAQPENFADFSEGFEGAFAFNTFEINIYVDHNPSTFYDATYANANNGDLWLQLTADTFDGSGDNLGSASSSDSGEASVLLHTSAGLAKDNFDTNSKGGGSDMLLNTEFYKNLGTSNTEFGKALQGRFSLIGDSIPEPTTIALLGLALISIAASRKKQI